MAARFNLSIENLVIFSIVSIMVVIFAFSLGVERGKCVALRDASATAGENKTDALAPAAAVKASAVSADSKVAPMGDALRAADSKAVKPVLAAVKDDKFPSAVVTPQASSVNATSKGTGYTIQLASYKSEKNAQREAQTLKGKGYQVFVLPKGQHVVLCVGNFQKKEDASVFGKKLKGRYQDFVVRRL